MMRLTQFLAEHDNAPFDWATHNCCHFAARWVKNVTGRDPMAGLPVTRDVRAARRLLRGLGGTMVDAWTAQLGYGPLASPKLAQTGDVVLLPMLERDGAVMGICAGGVAVVATAEGAIAFVPMADVTHAWRIEPCHA